MSQQAWRPTHDLVEDVMTTIFTSHRYTKLILRTQEDEFRDPPNQHELESDSSNNNNKKKKKIGVVVLVNNLGGSSHLEMGVVTKEVISYLLTHRENDEMIEIEVRGVVQGSVMTSLDMVGVSVSVLVLPTSPEEQETWMTALRAPTNGKGSWLGFGRPG